MKAEKENLSPLFGPVILVEVAGNQDSPAHTDAGHSGPDSSLPSTAVATGVAPGPAAGPVSNVQHRPKSGIKVRLGRIWLYFAKEGSIWRDFSEILLGLFSRDLPTRRISLLFVVFFMGLIAVSSVSILRFWNEKRAKDLHQNQQWGAQFSELIRRESEETKRRESTIALGTFTVEFKRIANQKLHQGVMNMAVLEIVLLCDSRATRDQIEKDTIQIRDRVNSLFSTMDREEFLSKEGKKKLKSQIIRRVNEWLAKGRVDDLFFSKILLH